MSDAEKVAAFDAIAAAFTNRWHDGQYSWFCLKPCGGEMHATPGEAVAEFVEWCKKVAEVKHKRSLN